MSNFLKKIFVGVVIVVIFISFLALGEKIYKKTFSVIQKFLPQAIHQQILVTEEKVVIDVVKEVGPSVVTVTATTPRRRVIQFSPFGGLQQGIEGGNEQDIGTGFIVSADGLIVTNKHVVSETELTYKVATSDGKTYDVKDINLDPNNDIAVIKIEANDLKPVRLGDSSTLQVGQYAIAIGTALGEFRNTVTTGVVSGLGRGITAGADYQGYIERLDNVIQTDAAINPGNSGGPLLNSSGEVIGVNVAVAASAQNIGFAIPINTVKEALNQFGETGEFPAKAFLGIQYQMIDKQVALLNNVPEGAYITDVVTGSPAESSGIQIGDVIYKVNGESVSAIEGGIGKIISDKKVGDSLDLELWRDGKIVNLNVVLSEYDQ